MRKYYLSSFKTIQQMLFTDTWMDITKLAHSRLARGRGG